MGLVHLSTFTIKINQMSVDIRYIDHTGYDVDHMGYDVRILILYRRGAQWGCGDVHVVESRNPKTCFLKGESMWLVRYSGDLIIGSGVELSEKGFGERNIFILFIQFLGRDFLNIFIKGNLN